MNDRRTVTVNATPGDATKAAEEIAGRLRAAGKLVTIGPEYEQTEGHKAGYLSVDLTVDDAPEAAPEPVTVTEAPAVTAAVSAPAAPAVDSDIPEHLREDSLPADDADLDRYKLPQWTAKGAKPRRKRGGA